MFWYQNYLGLLKFFVGAFFSETLHVASKKYKIKRKILFFFFVNTNYISFCEFKTSEFSRVQSTHENSDVFNTDYKIFWYSPKKK